MSDFPATLLQRSIVLAPRPSIQRAFQRVGVTLQASTPVTRSGKPQPRLLGASRAGWLRGEIIGPIRQPLAVTVSGAIPDDDETIARATGVAIHAVRRATLPLREDGDDMLGLLMNSLNNPANQTTDEAGLVRAEVSIKVDNQAKLTLWTYAGWLSLLIEGFA